MVRMMKKTLHCAPPPPPPLSDTQNSELPCPNLPPPMLDFFFCLMNDFSNVLVKILACLAAPSHSKFAFAFVCLCG